MNIFGHEFGVPLSAVSINDIAVEPLEGVIIPLIPESVPDLEDFLAPLGYDGTPYLFAFDDIQPTLWALCMEQKDGNCEVIDLSKDEHSLFAFSSPGERRAFEMLVYGAVADHEAKEKFGAVA